jgi:hypothetical protein
MVQLKRVAVVVALVCMLVAAVLSAGRTATGSTMTGKLQLKFADRKNIVAPTPPPRTDDQAGKMAARAPPATLSPDVKSESQMSHVEAFAAAALSPKKPKLLNDWSADAFDIDRDIGPVHGVPKNGSKVCELFLMGLPDVCGIERGDEDMLQCIDRVGGEVLQRAIPPRCTKTEYWQSVRTRGPKFTGTETGRDWVYHAQVTSGLTTPVKYVPPAERTFPRDVESRVCSWGTVHPIVFGVPHRNVVPAVTRHKLFDFLPYKMKLHPPAWNTENKNHTGYGYYRWDAQDEQLIFLLHKYSYYGWTHRRGGWDCMRHYEILQAGTLPYFADISRCGKMCMALFPKQLLIEAMEVQGVAYMGHSNSTTPMLRHFIDPTVHGTAILNFNNTGVIRHAEFDRARYFDVAEKLLAYTRANLTTKSVAAYIMHKMGVEEPKNVLLVGRGNNDYLETAIFSGFADLGINYTTNTLRPMFTQVRDRAGGYTAAEMEEKRSKAGLSFWIHGAGMVHGMRAPPLVHDTNNTRIQLAIRNNEYDLVLYTWWEWDRENKYPFWKDVMASTALPRERRAMFDGADDGPEGRDGHRDVLEYAQIFRRELHDTCGNTKPKKRAPTKSDG